MSPMRSFVRCIVIVAALAALTSCRKPAKQTRVDISDAPNRKESPLALDGAKILLDKGGAYDRLCSSLPNGGRSTSKGASPCIDHHFYVFPVVPQATTTATSVPAWVTCRHSEKSLAECEQWMRAYTGAIAGAVTIRISVSGGSGWDDAARDASTRFGLQLVAGAPVLVLGGP